MDLYLCLRRYIQALQGCFGIFCFRLSPSGRAFFAFSLLGLVPGFLFWVSCFGSVRFPGVPISLSAFPRLWGCDPQLFRVIQMLHRGASCKVRVHGGLSKAFVLEHGLREGCPSSPVLFNIYHAAAMMDSRARRKEAASAGQMDEGIDWLAQVDGGLFWPRSSQKRGRRQLRTVLGDVEFADDTVTWSAASFVLLLNSFLMTPCTGVVGGMSAERLLVVPNARRVRVSEPSCAEVRPRVKLVRHVGGLPAADGRRDHDTSKRVSRARRVVGMIARSWSRGQMDRRGRSSPLSLPLQLRLMKAHVDPILSTFCCRSRSWSRAQLRSLKRAQAYALCKAFGVDRLSM